MNDFFKSPLLRAILAFAALLIVGLIVWFVGPLLSFGDMQPLAGVGLRVTTILLLLLLVVCVLLKLSLSPLLVIAVSLLIWNIGPLLGFGAFKPFEPVWVRVLMVALVVLIYLVWAVYTLWKLIRSDEAFAKRIFSRNKSRDAVAREEIRSLRAKARQAVARLKEMRMTMAGHTGSLVAALRRLVEGKRYLYELPWYMVIGNPGAGKSTALLNSGLKFPVTSQSDSMSARLMLEGDEGGTLNCAWWFANEAVLIDTAGRYTHQENKASEKPLVKAGKIEAEAAETNADAEASQDADNKKSDKDAAQAQKDEAAKKAASEYHASAEELNRAEWQGFLGVLREVRARAPINGALLTVDLRELLAADASARLAHARRLCSRLEELRQRLGIRFPVYVMVTKADCLRGFSEYFSSLTTEARAQPWGFTLPWQEETGKLQQMAKRGAARAGKMRRHAGSSIAAADTSRDQTAKKSALSLAEQLRQELALLQQRIADGVATRMQEEFELDRRRTLYLLPHEMAAVAAPLVELLEQVFVDSRYDTTQATHMLRGVYFTSAAQYEGEEIEKAPVVMAEKTALASRLMRSLKGHWEALGGNGGAETEAKHRVRPSGTRSYFLADVFSRVVFPEAHLVKPNLRWETRFRLLSLIGHALVVLTFVWLASGMMVSYQNNSSYLAAVSVKIADLGATIKKMSGARDLDLHTKVLNGAQSLAAYEGLNLADPPATFGFGLYSARPIVRASEEVYARFADRLVLPEVLHRMEAVMAYAVESEDPKLSFDTLYAYLLLHDANRYRDTPNANEILKAWVMRDWESASGATGNAASAKRDGEEEDLKDSGPNLAVIFGNSAAMAGHLEGAFSGQRVVQSATAKNDVLIRKVRAFLDGNLMSERVYQRVKIALMADAPPPFTLVRALGPQVGNLFARASGASLEQGVSGLFSFDGYHKHFTPRLPDMLELAKEEDAWVMGAKVAANSETNEKKVLMEEVRRQYLNEYAQQWQQFLDDIRVISSEQSTLSFEVSVVQQLAAADSPLIRMGKLMAKETTLSRPLTITSNDEKSFFEKAGDELEQKKAKGSKNLMGLSATQLLERQVVDNQFSALREVVTGQSEGAAAPGAKPALSAITNALNEYYTVLVVAQSAISANSMPPGDVSGAATKLRVEAGKLPAPFREVMNGVSYNGVERVTRASEAILRVQAQAQVDRLVAQMNSMVGDPCRRNIAGRYPFAASAQDVSIEDFNALFASGGVADDFFTKSLQGLVDMSARPWRYKTPEMVAQDSVANATAGAGPASGAGGPSVRGEMVKLLAQGGPNPDVFAQIAAIREVFFRDAGGKRMSMRMEMKMQSMEPSINELLIDIDGQVEHYAHGPVRTIPVLWPGSRGGSMATLSASPRIRPDTSTLMDRGPWALMRLMERGKVIQTTDPGRVGVEFVFDGRRAVFEMASAGFNPLSSRLLKEFTCPGRAQ